LPIARALASKKVSPKGPVSGLRMLNYFINRRGKGLPASRLAELEKAKALLSKRVHREKKGGMTIPRAPFVRKGQGIGLAAVTL
jgi:hypothetical protein